ncbi:MAG: tRNA 4-thiouridine(8) synthase ThiI [Bacilli bacterium]|nr:tRNA 4-thiouridine(8) synthase ThiI [Bacilli bacterium]
MKYDCLLIRFGELNTKGRNKQEFINLLYRNIKQALRDFPNLEFIKAHDRIYVNLNETDNEAVVARLKTVSGIENMSFVYKVESDITKIIATSLELAESKETGTFKVVTRRSDKRFPIHSDDVNRAVAEVILQKTKHTVDVHHPSFFIKIEIRDEGTFIFFDSIKGLGGYPLGVGGKSLVLLSGGIDSPVASFMMMKRGVKIEAIHYASPPYTAPGALAKVVDLLKVLSKIQGPIALHIVPFTKLQEAVYDTKDESYAITLMRRMMYRIAEQVALKRNCLALVSGESIGQVASQTLNSMAVINEVIKMPMIRPLATYDKEEIINISKSIGTYEISIRPFIDCCTIFTPKNPVIKPVSSRAVELEAKFDYQTLVNECVENIQTIYIDENYSSATDATKYL